MSGDRAFGFQTPKQNVYTENTNLFSDKKQIRDKTYLLTVYYYLDIAVSVLDMSDNCYCFN